jgi:hypothetical protein
MTSAVRTRAPAPSLLVRGGLAVVVAVLADVGLVLGVTALGVAPAFRAVTVPPVAFLSALGAGGAAVVYRLAQRYVRDADRTFVRGAAVLHVVVAAVSVGLLVGWRTGQ